MRVITGASGTTVKQVEYDSFGNILTDSNPAFTVPFGFAGGLHDRDINLVRFGFRDYDSETGRWTAKDPIGFDGGEVDLWGYVQGDPVNWVDPSGESAVEVMTPIAVGIAMLDTFVPGPMDVIAGAVIGVSYLIDTFPEDNSYALSSGNDDACPKERSPYPPGKRDRSNTKKEAYEKAKKAGGGNEPRHDPDDPRGPHYHPDVPMPRPDSLTPKTPSPHDHYLYPKNRR